MPILNKDMTLCISLAGRPSNLGTRFHNFLYDELGLNFVYKAFTTDDIEGLVLRIDTYREYGYFPPAQAQSVMDMARRAVVTEPPRLLATFVERYARA